MNVEKQVRRAKRAVVFWRLAAAVLVLPRCLFRAANTVTLGVAHVFDRLTEFFNEVDKSLFYLEADAARRYTLLTGGDLGIVAGESNRYVGFDAETTEKNRKLFLDASGGA